MKKVVSGVILVLLVGLFVSCVSLSDKEMSAQEQAEYQVIGSVTATFRSFQFFHIPAKNSLKNKAYLELKKAAQSKYEGNVDIRNITISGGGSALTLLPTLLPVAIGASLFLIPSYYHGEYYDQASKKYVEYYREDDVSRWGLMIGLPIAGLGAVIGNVQKITAIGDVVVRVGRNAANTPGVEGALTRAVGSVSENFTPRSRIAIVQITAPDRSTRDFMIGELEHILRRQGYYMVDRAQLDRIFEEQRFGATSDVDDSTAARMGRISGASIVITGRIDGEGSLRRLRLRALDTQTAQVLGTASERL